LGKKLKIAGAVIGGIIILIIIGVVASFVAPGSVYKTDPSKITGVTQFFVLKDGSLYKARFSLTDKDNNIVTSDGKVSFDAKTDTGLALYHTDFNVKSEDFKTYSLVLTGAPVIAYAWQINGQSLTHPSNVFPKAYLTVTLPNGKSFNADTSFF
jgi:hypothetical protein